MRLKDTTLKDVCGLSITTDRAAVIAATISSSEVSGSAIYSTGAGATGSGAFTTGSGSFSAAFFFGIS